MDLLEMGAHIPCSSYAPVYIPTMNHNLSANGSERNHNLTSDQLFWYYKEVFKQKMLNQEMIFKNQILDLHRLYGRQRELMDDITRNELDKHNLGTEVSRRTTSLSQTSLVCAQKTFNIPACSQVSISGAENIQSPSCFLQGRNIRACSYPAQTEGHSGDREFLKSKCKKPRKNLDLRLPADTIYIDSEEEELLEDGKVSEAAEVSSYPTKRIPEVVCNGDATNGFNSVSNYASSASLEKGWVDLNYLYKLQEKTAPASDSFEGPTAVEAYSNILLQGTESKQEWLSSYNYNAGKIQSSLYSLPRGFHADDISSSSNSLHKKLTQQEPSSFLHNHQNSSSERAMIAVQNFRRNSKTKNDHQSGPSGALMCTSSQHIPRDCMEHSGSSGIAALRKPMHDLARTQIAVQALPCLNTSIPLSNNCKSSTLRRGLEEERLQLKKHLRSSTKHDGTVSDSSFSNGFDLESNKSGAQPPSISSDNLIRVNDGLVPELHGITRYLQDSANVNAWKDIDLNFMPPSCSSDAAVSQSFQTTGTEKLEDSNERFPLHRPKLDYYGKTDKGCEDSNQAEASDFLSQQIHGSPTCETPNISGDHCYHVSGSNHHQNSVQDIKDSKRAVLLDLNVPCDSVHNKEVEPTVDEHVEKSKFKKDAGFGVHIDLNSSINDVGFGVHIDLNTSVNEDEFSAMSSSSTESLLEAPASPENKECSPPRGVSSDGNQVDTPDLMSGLEAPENKESSPPTGESDENHVEIPFPLSVQQDLEHKVCSQPTESDEKVDAPSPLSVHEDLEHKVCSRPTESDEQIETPFALSGQGGLQNKECSQPIESDENQSVTPLPLSNMESKDCSKPMDSDENQIETPFPSGLDGLESKDCSQPMDSDETQIQTPLPRSGQENLETKECSQPMDSTEIQIETPFLLSGQEVHLEEELFRTAAECLVTISSSVCHTCSERTTYKPTETSSDSLKWFAGLASSVLGSLKNEVGCGDHQEVLPDGMDYFEAMTLKLPESKVEECCCYRSNGYKEEVMVTSSSQSQPKKGRPRKGRQQRKDFQREILPGLASLSRCQVTEDLQIIGTLIEASADCSETRSVRHAAKFGLARGRRRCTISASAVKENTAASPLNHIGVKRQLECEKRSLIDWGEVTRRRRGQRNSGSDLRLIRNKV
ncbi:uncharacterized protein LOC133742602 isoform X2 [Rosa rugosa]|uniref:uncharacterized protein LOC133742602 isoform X2 n=1 Tax=Rosa rugosa TaxID=74645 RepID=UPI002B4118FC|nr:uncharacterized protein LOC133742602 isoform X2 [Rosa rugosa]